MKKKILTVLALVLVVAAVVVICTSCAKKEEAKEETAKIRYTLVNQTGEAITNITMKEKIGSFYGTRWMKDDIEVIFFDWYDGQYDIRLYQRGEDNEILKDAILKGDYDADTDTLTATGEFDNEEPFTVTFSYDENNHIVWTENGESTVLEYSTLED